MVPGTRYSTGTMCVNSVLALTVACGCPSTDITWSETPISRGFPPQHGTVRSYAKGCGMTYAPSVDVEEIINGVGEEQQQFSIVTMLLPWLIILKSILIY